MSKVIKIEHIGTFIKGLKVTFIIVTENFCESEINGDAM